MLNLANKRDMADRERHIFIAKLAEQSEKYDEMVRSMKMVAEMKKELSVEERNLLSVGYKNVIGSRRAAWRTIAGIEAKAIENGDNPVRINTAKEYREQIEQEMKTICNDALQTLDSYLIPISTTTENKVFFYKMKGDYYRYMLEFLPTDSETCENSLDAYKMACDIAMADDGLEVTHPVRLGLVLNFSVFFYEILGDRSKAMALTRDAYEKAIKVVDRVPREWQKDTMLVMQLLRDNIAVWNAETQGGISDPDADLT